MPEAFAIVVFGVVIVAVVVAIAAIALSRGAFDEIGAGGLHDGSDGAAPEPASGAGFTAVRDAEARQMLKARSARRVRRGEEPLDIERELERLLRPSAAAPDPRLVAEVRDLVLASNRRRVRQGKEPLDVESEVARRLSGPG